MDQTVSIVLFDGQFWITIIEKTDQDGIISIGRHVFGASEPTNNELLNFYLIECYKITCLRSTIKVRVKAKKQIKEQLRITNKSKDTFKQLQKESLIVKIKIKKKQVAGELKELYQKRSEKVINRI